MDENEAIRELRAKYDALQKRVTRFLAVEQKLIDTGYRLERELARFEAIYGYSKRLIGIEELDEFADTTAEAVVDVFEVEVGAMWLLDSAGKLPVRPMAVAGSSNAGIDWPALGAELVEWGFPSAVKPLAEIIAWDDSGERCLSGISRLVASPLLNPNGTPVGIVLGMVTKPSRLFYDITTEEYAGSFNVFAQLVGTLLQNRADQEIIQHQIEALRQSEVQLVRARDASEAASRAKSAFLANMSHEIRTPMNGVLGMTELLVASGQLDGNQRRLAEMAHRSAKSLLGIINEVLDFSKIEAGRMRLSEEDFVLQRLLEDCLDLVADEARRKGLQLIADFPTGLNRPVRGDPVRVRQVLINLLANAVKFTEQGEVLFRAVVLSQDSSGLNLLFEIRDTGPGIEPDQHDKIFSAFEQADGSSARRHGGTGLGLAIARQLITLMGGEIGFTSERDRGTCFQVRLHLAWAMGTSEEIEDRNASEEAQAESPRRVPSPQEDSPQPPSSAAVSPPRLPKKILLVEDNPVNQMVALGMLEVLGYQADAASNGRQALDLMAHVEYELVLMDCHMPRMDGFEAATEARRLEREQDRDRIPIIALTADVEKGIEERCRTYGMDGYLSKPFKLAQLETILMQWLA